MRAIKYLLQIWQHSAPGFVFLPIREAATGTWIEGDPILRSDAGTTLEARLADDAPGYDLYFTPATYDSPLRRKEVTADMGVLYADLDDGYDAERLDELPPSLLWETSPGRRQAIWLLTVPQDPAVAIAMNRRLSLYLLADHGSWMPTKLLRVPTSTNWKRGGEKGVILDDNMDRWRMSVLDSYLPEYPETLSLGGGVPAVPSLENHRALLERWWPRLSRRAKKIMSQAQVADRSLALATLANEMATISIPPAEIFGLLSRLPINKFRGRPKVLWESVVLTAVSHVRQ